MAPGGLGRVALILTVAVLAATYLPSLALGLQRYVLVGSSMEPSIHRGSLVFDEVVPVRALRRGDVVTYVPPGAAHPLSHRIVSIAERGGRRLFRMRGDNNRVADPGPVTFRRPVQARVKLAIPYVGWVYIALTAPEVRRWLVVVPALLLSLWALGGVWREGGTILRERARAEAP
jgi:signal peptidase I